MGCLKSFFALIGMATVVAVMSVAGWHYRAELKEMYLTWANDSSAVEITRTESIGRPSETGLREALRKNAEMESADGSALVTLTADQMASLIAQGISRGAADSFDSLTLTLGDGTVTLDALVQTEVFARELLGQFGSILDRSEHIRVSGPVRMSAPGVMAWEPDALRMRSFPFPGAAVGPMINAVTGGSDGAFLIRVPATIGDLRVRPDGVTFYRRTD
jgi:hypothetical protein